MIKIKSRKNLVIIAAVVLALAGGLALYYKKHQDSTAPSGSGINYGPPTQQEKQDAEDHKKEIDQQEAAAQNNSSPSNKSVTPLIVSYVSTDTALKVSARVPGVLEGSGTCTLTLSKNGQKVSQTKTAAPNVSEMSCGFISVARSKLSSGTWSAVVSYSSAKASGSSQPMDVKVD